MKRLLSTRSPQRGFALIITLALVAMLVLVVLALTSLVKVDSKLTDTTLSQTKARQNALLALDVAIAQLQKHAGPDARSTATGDAFGPPGAKYYTGVWDVAGGATAKTWLVSGSESTTTNPVALLDGALDPTTEPTPNDVYLVGDNTIATAAGSPTAEEKKLRVKLPKVPVLGEAPGMGNSVRVGSYAWWVGDQGVKASIGLRDRGDEVTYSPWDTVVQRRRIRQQISGGATYFSGQNTYGFDPFDTSNFASLKNLISREQLVGLKPISTSASLPRFIATHFHALTDSTFGVLANTKPGGDVNRGLLRDLSLAPELLGPAFSAYANYRNYMETPASGNKAFPSITNVDSSRRRYSIVLPVTAQLENAGPELTFSVAPVLTTFFLQYSFFNGSTPATANQITVACRLYVELWNPYTSALVPPDDLTVEISGLPQVTVGGTQIDLAADLPTAIAGSNGSIVAKLPFTAANVTMAGGASWLPGRLYAWVTSGAAGQSLEFHEKNISHNAGGWYYPKKATAIGLSANAQLSVTGPTVSNLKVTLRNSQGIVAVYNAPIYPSFVTPAPGTNWKFAFTYRIKQPSNADKDRSWLETYDPRGNLVPTAMDFYDPNKGGHSPDLYNVQQPISSQHLLQFLLYRTQGKTSVASNSAHNDVPLFELPRLPFLSLGELQHLQFKNLRPFALGNSWGGAANRVFDRYFFSGLPTTGSRPALQTNEPLPNWNLLPVDTRRSPAQPLTVDDLRDGNNRTSANYPYSSRYLMQAGAFNLNSTNQTAWRAVLSGVRFGSARPFQRAIVDNSQGSNALGTQRALGQTTRDETFINDPFSGVGNAAPVFFRFPQSAQETYDWLAGPATHSQALSTQAFRQGVRGNNPTFSDPDFSPQQLHNLETSQIETLATSVARLVREKLASSGPFRSIEEFLSASSAYGGRSLLEKAIEDADINPASMGSLVPASAKDPGFSSLTLTQADIITGIAPYLRNRTDTFLIRVYGESVNAVTQEVESGAWAEALVQRTPETVDASDNLLQPSLNGFGRKFKILSFRWLSPSEI